METIYQLPEPWLVIGTLFRDLFVHVATLSRTAANPDEEIGAFHCFPIDERGVIHDEMVSYAGLKDANYIHIGKKGEPINGYSLEFIRALAVNAMESPVLDAYNEIKRFIGNNGTELYFGTEDGEPLILKFVLTLGYDEPLIVGGGIYSIDDINSIEERQILFDNTPMEGCTPESAAKAILRILDTYFETFPKPDCIELSAEVSKLINKDDFPFEDEFKDAVLDILLAGKIAHGYTFRKAAK